MNIYEKVQVAKLELLQRNIKKSGRNAFANYKYYELSDILPHIISVCNELKMFTHINFLDDYAVLTIVNSEDPNETIEYKCPMKDLVLKGANAVQALGGVTTYMRRYLYMAAFDIIENDMFDAMSPEQIESGKKEAVEKALATEQTIKSMKTVIKAYAERIGKTPDQLESMFIKKIGATSIDTLTEVQAKDIQKRVKVQLDKLNN